MRLPNRQNVRTIGMSAFMLAVITVGVVGVAASQSKAVVKRCVCPQIVFPVKCSNGVTYINGCYAACAGATGCVPTEGPIE